MTDLTRLWHYSRPQLAQSLARRLIAHERFAMFGPRQTGKTTLLRDEVMPELVKAGVLPVYIECWADRSDPLASINYALQRELSNIEVPKSGVKRAAKTPVKKLGALGMSVEFGDDARRTPAATPHLLFDSLLNSLLDASGSDVVLIFDEFQVVAKVKDGDNIGAAIRAALTQVSRRVGAIFSGSSDTELLRMFSQAQTPLYGFASAEAYELLDVDFVGHVARQFKAATKRDLGQVDAQRVFDLMGHQPEPFLQAVSITMAKPAWTLDMAIADMLSPMAKSKWSIAWYDLTPLQRAALMLVFDGKPPSSADSRAWAARETKQKSVVASTIMRAHEALMDKQLIVRDPVGRQFKLIDPVMTAWLKANKNLSCVDPA